ncbi:hypothetical protein [Actinomadura sp. WMMB 499]|uniref:hypothetical protein n=1 Tax=Actinomadura sp. WMMB 499 TaxID=1219491 RepID=UPI001246A245|nr:hypothetical protein [Actinomadura sp. WMMB 499]QFG25954.1 hypothetical protein F7P10_37220 [Actinomadura sp. WMMB 499]
MTNSLARRKLAILPLVLLPFGAVAACGGTNTETDCGVNSCTVTFDRGVEASASILGVEAELVSVEGETVTLAIEGNNITVPVGDQQPEEAEGFDVSVKSVTQEQVVVEITANA